MNQSLIAVDASVTVKWVLDEQFTEQAQALLAGAVRDARQVVGPPHATAEVCNIIYRRRLRTDPAFRITDEEADQALVRFLRLPLTLLSVDDLYHQSFQSPPRGTVTPTQRFTPPSRACEMSQQPRRGRVSLAHT